MSFDPVEICAVLADEGVDFVVLGGQSWACAATCGIEPAAWRHDRW